MEIILSAGTMASIGGSIWNIIVWIVFGAIAGALAKWIMPGKDPGGFWVTVLIGIGGAFVGGFLGELLFDIKSGGRSILGWDLVIAIVGALILLWLWKKVIAPMLNK